MQHCYPYQTLLILYFFATVIKILQTTAHIKKYISDMEAMFFSKAIILMMLGHHI